MKDTRENGKDEGKWKRRGKMKKKRENERDGRK